MINQAARQVSARPVSARTARQYRVIRPSTQKRAKGHPFAFAVLFAFVTCALVFTAGLVGYAGSTPAIVAALRGRRD